MPEFIPGADGFAGSVEAYRADIERLEKELRAAGSGTKLAQRSAPVPVVVAPEATLTGAAGGDLEGTYPNPRIRPGGVRREAIASLAVDTERLNDDAVTEGKLADGAVSEVKLADGAVGVAKIADGAVTEGKLAFDPATQGELEAHAATVASAAAAGHVRIGEGLEIDPVTGVLSAVGGGGEGGGASLSNVTPQPLGTAAPGTATTASRSDHVHARPNIEALPSAIHHTIRMVGGGFQDHRRGVLLLHAAYDGEMLPTNYAIGTVVGLRGDQVAYDRVCVARVVSQSAYDTDLATVESLTGTIPALMETPWRMVTCRYNGVKYVALDVPYRSFNLNNGVRFEGWLQSSAPLALTYVPYYDTSGNVVLSGEIQDSLADLPSNLLAYHRGALRADTVNVQTAIGHLGGYTLDGLGAEARYIARSYTNTETATVGAGGIFSTFRARGTKDAPADPIAGDTLGRWASGGWDSVLGGWRSVAYITARARGVWSPTAMPAILEFHTAPVGSKAPTLSATLDSDSLRVYGVVRADDGYQAADGTPGASATTGGATFKNGLYTGGTISGGGTSARTLVTLAPRALASLSAGRNYRVTADFSAAGSFADPCYASRMTASDAAVILQPEENARTTSRASWTLYIPPSYTFPGTLTVTATLAGEGWTGAATTGVAAAWGVVEIS